MENNYEFLMSPLLVAIGHGYSQLKDDFTIHSHGYGIVFDKENSPYFVTNETDPKKAKEIADNLGFTLGGGFTGISLKDLGKLTE